MTLRDARALLKPSTLIVLAGFSGCASHVDLGMGAAPVPAVMPSRAAAFRVTPLERDFMTQVSAKSLYEVEVSRLAAARALNPSVRRFADAMVAQYTQSNGELLALMNARAIPAPHMLSDDQAAKLQRLAAVPPSDAFDNGYIRVVGIEDRQEAIATFEKARDEVRDPELRAWIERTLTALRNQLSAAQVIAGTLVG